MCQVTTGETLWPRLAGAILLIVGPRPISLALASASGALLLKSLLTYPISAYRSPGEEHLIFLGLPLVAILVALASHGRERRVADTAQLVLLRLSATIVMFFVGFHKLNSDFFLPSVSCSHALGGLLDKAWALPLADWNVLPPPAVVVALELTSAFLLVFFPRVGFVLAALLLTPIALFGPTALVTTVLSLAIAGLRADDLALFRASLSKECLRLIPLWIAIGALVLILYERPHPARYLGFLLVVTTLLYLAVQSLLRDSREPSWRSLFAHPLPIRAVLVAFLMLGLTNGFAPYLGIKSKMSLAMFSNLRTDTDRWNHLLVPAGFYLRESDPFIHLEKVEFILPTGRRPKGRFPNRGRDHLYRSLLTPESLRYRVEVLGTRKMDANLHFVYAGEAMSFERVVANAEFAVWLEGLPAEKFFQRNLRLGEPQICVH